MLTRTLAAGAALLLVLVLAGSASAATLRADYRFQGSHASAVGQAPAAQDIGPGTNAFATDSIDGPRQVLTFPNGNGISVSTQGIAGAGEYTIVALFRLADMGTATTYRRIFDFKNGTHDNGIYYRGGQLTIYRGDHPSDPVISGGNTVVPGVYAQVTVTRETDNRFWTAYLNGNLAVSVDDVAGDGVLSSNVLRLFRDFGGANETSAGALARLRIWDGALTEQQIAALDRVVPDGDGDGRDDDLDNCPTAPNVNQANGDGDAQGDACDPDHDNDSVPNASDNCPLLPNVDQANADGGADGGDACDEDDDNDGVPDASDPEPRNALIPGPFGATNGNDTLSGTPAADKICGLLGNDVINGVAGNDTLYGDACDKKAKLIVGAQIPTDGNDKLNGGDGNDALYGAGGKDTLKGGKGKDKLFGGDGNDTLSGEDGKDTLDGGKGNDKLTGGKDVNSYKGGAGDDTVSARNKKKDTIDCGAGKKDKATVDRIDKVKGCETVSRK